MCWQHRYLRKSLCCQYIIIPQSVEGDRLTDIGMPCLFVYERTSVFIYTLWSIAILWPFN